MNKHNRLLITLVAAITASQLISLNVMAGGYYIEGYEGSMIEKSFNETQDRFTDLRTIWSREVSDVPVESIYYGTPENNIEGQFDMAGAIKAFEYVQQHRFPRGTSTKTLKAYIWSDALAEQAKKVLSDRVALGNLNSLYGFDNTGSFDQSRLYRFDFLFAYSTGCKDSFDISMVYAGDSIDEALRDCISYKNYCPFTQRDYSMSVGAAVMNHNGKKLLLFICCEEDYHNGWEKIFDKRSTDALVKEFSVTFDDYCRDPAWRSYANTVKWF